MRRIGAATVLQAVTTTTNIAAALGLGRERDPYRYWNARCEVVAVDDEAGIVRAVRDARARGKRRARRSARYRSAAARPIDGCDGRGDLRFGAEPTNEAGRAQHGVEPQ